MLRKHHVFQITKLPPQPATQTSITWRPAGRSSGWPGSWAARARGSGRGPRRQRCRRACTWSRRGYTCPAEKKDTVIRRQAPRKALTAQVRLCRWPFRRWTAWPGSGDGCVAAGHAKVTLKGSLLLPEVSPVEVLRPHNLGVPFQIPIQVSKRIRVPWEWVLRAQAAPERGSRSSLTRLSAPSRCSSPVALRPCWTLKQTGDPGMSQTCLSCIKAGFPIKSWQKMRQHGTWTYS